MTIQDEDGVKVDYIKEVKRYFEEFEMQDVVLRGENIPFGIWNFYWTLIQLIVIINN